MQKEEIQWGFNSGIFSLQRVQSFPVSGLPLFSLETSLSNMTYSSSYCVIVRVRVVLKRTVVGD